MSEGSQPGAAWQDGSGGKGAVLEMTSSFPATSCPSFFLLIWVFKKKLNFRGPSLNESPAYVLSRTAGGLGCGLQACPKLALVLGSLWPLSADGCVGSGRVSTPWLL